MKKKFKLKVVCFFWWTFNSTKKITRSQKTNPEFKKQIPCFSVIAHIHKISLWTYVAFLISGCNENHDCSTAIGIDEECCN
jgi:hypothetical protein